MDPYHHWLGCEKRIAQFAISIQQLDPRDLHLTVRLNAVSFPSIGLQRLASETCMVKIQGLLRISLVDHLAFMQENRSVAEFLDHLLVVRDDDHGLARFTESVDPLHALVFEHIVADGQHLVNEQHVGVHVGGHGETSRTYMPDE